MKRITENILTAVAVVLMSMSTVSCGEKDPTLDNESWSERTIYLGDYGELVEYNAQGVWAAYGTGGSGLNLDGLMYSYKYDSATGEYYGMIPSRRYDPENRGADFVDYPNWAGTIVHIPGEENIALSFGSPFILAHWDSEETTDAIPSSPALKMQYGCRIYPESIVIANASYTYFTMESSNPGRDDSVTLIITGVLDGKKTGSVEVDLSQVSSGKYYYNEWASVNLGALELVDYIYFQMKGTGSGTNVIATAPYFCMGAFSFGFGTK